jgi:hypothetical protein
MNPTRPQSVNPTCPSCAGSTFEIRALKDEGLASAQCVRCQRDYLVLDSEKYWFDVIQEGYPKLKRCRCKETNFGLRFDYSYRDGGDVKAIETWTTCSSCLKTQRLMVSSIRYSGTEDLVEHPLRYCKNPKVLYDLKKLTLYATRHDIASVVDYLSSQHHCVFDCWLVKENAWVRYRLGTEETKKAIFGRGGGGTFGVPESYLYIYAQPKPVEIPDVDVNELDQEAVFWKRHDVIRISSPFHIGLQDPALLFYINFSNEYVENEQIVRKPDSFTVVTDSLIEWMKANFVSWRGPNCFDTREEHFRIFGDRYEKSRSSSSENAGA